MTNTGLKFCAKWCLLTLVMPGRHRHTLDVLYTIIDEGRDCPYFIRSGRVTGLNADGQA
jgi:hypothetical protein